MGYIQYIHHLGPRLLADARVPVCIVEDVRRGKAVVEVAPDPKDLKVRVKRQVTLGFSDGLRYEVKDGLKEGETPARLHGYAAYVYMTDPQLGKKFLEQLDQVSAPTEA